MKRRRQTELPLYGCTPPTGEAGVGRCWAHTLDLKSTVKGMRLVTRLCPRGACLCPVCAAADAVVASYEARHG